MTSIESPYFGVFIFAWIPRIRQRRGKIGRWCSLASGRQPHRADFTSSVSRRGLRMGVLSLFLSLFLLSASASGSSPQPVMVDLGASLGRVVGSRSTPGAQGVDRFLGIPFAKPPILARRFAPPAPFAGPFPDHPALGARTHDGTRFGAMCPQSPSSSLYPRANQSEDCLTLNVFRPAAANQSAAGLPVLVFIYGGG
jgi:Carboxylesterase family